MKNLNKIRNEQVKRLKTFRYLYPFLT